MRCVSLVLRRLLVGLLLLGVCGSLARAESLRTLDGRTFEGPISAVYGDLVFVAAKGGSYRLTVSQLDDASLRLVAAFSARPASPPPLWREATSKLGKGLTKKLRVLRDGKLAEFVPGDRPEPEFYLVYFGAFWCGPCRRFSPKLVSTYHELKRTAPDRFEVIFVSDDRDSGGQLDYAREVQMPFPILRFGTSIPEFDRWRGRGIPCLVVLNRQGDLLFHSYSGEEYLGAADPLNRFAQLHAQLAQPHTKRSPEDHRFAVAAHLNAAAAGDRPPEPYLVSINPKRNRTLPKGLTLTARLQIDRTGRVTDAEFTPQLETIAANQLQAETQNWLFLPAVRQGRAEPATIEVPLTTPE